MSHGAHGHGDTSNPLSKYIGITMAMLGVLLALCSALVGAARTELIATMVEQTNTSLQYQAVATKHRTLLAQLQQLHALMPLDPVAFEKSQNEIKRLVADNARAPIAPALSQLQLEGDMILNSVVPTPSDVARFVELVRLFDVQRVAAHEWAESYEDAIHVHSMQAEHYEWGQLAAEIGIVIASIALMLVSRRAWLLSLLMLGGAVVIVGFTFVTSRAQLGSAHEKIHHAKTHYESTIDVKGEQAGDDKLIADILNALPPSARPAATPAAAHHE